MRPTLKIKKITQSKTFWFNIAMIVILSADLYIELFNYSVQVAYLAGVGNIVLRVFFTNSAIGLHKQG